MGSTSMHRDPGLTDREFFERELLIPGEHRLLGCATKRTSGEWNAVFYAAIETIKTGEVFGLVVLIQRLPRGYYNFTYKALDDTTGPNEDQCPLKILDLLTPTESVYANEWRQRCRDQAAKVAARPKVKTGDRVKFTHPLSFTDGQDRDEFLFVKGSVFRAASGFGTFRISNWRSREYTVLVTVGPAD